MSQKKRMGKDPFESQLDWIQDSREKVIEKPAAPQVQIEKLKQVKTSENKEEEILALLSEINQKLNSFKKPEQEIQHLREEITTLREKLEQDTQIYKNPWLFWFPWVNYK